MWYDVETGDILTTRSARNLTSSSSRILDKKNHVLARNATQMRIFLECKEDSCMIPTQQSFDLDLIEAWSDVSLAILISTDVPLDAVKETLDLNEVSVYENDSSVGKVLLADRKLKQKVISTLSKMGAQISFVSRESIEQSFRSKQIVMASGDLPMKRQDRMFQIVQENVMLTMVFDGHGQNDVIEFISANYYDLATIIMEPFPETHGEALVRTREAFKKFDENIKLVRNAPTSGSTIVLAAHKLSTKQCFFAHVGDSRAIWSLGENQIDATEDHKASLSSEKKRVEEAGGFISKEAHDVPRVNGVLAPSRSFGDTALKIPLNRQKKDFVSALPDVNGPFTFTSGSLYVLGSDGIFDVLSNEVVLSNLQEVNSREVMDICKLARNKGSHDDITLVAVRVL